jgi:hypothetical protein
MMEERFNKFELLKEQWHADTCFHSNPTIIMRHPACRGIVEMGQDAIPFIIKEIEGGDHWIAWSWLLAELTGLDPRASRAIEQEDGFTKTDVDLLAEWWLGWYYSIGADE